MPSGLDWERFGVITGGDEVCILPPPTLSENGVGIPTSVHFPFLKCGGIRGAPLNHRLGYPRVPTSPTEIFSSRDRFNAILQQIALP